MMNEAETDALIERVCMACLKGEIEMIIDIVNASLRAPETPGCLLKDIINTNVSVQVHENSGNDSDGADGVSENPCTCCALSGNIQCLQLIIAAGGDVNFANSSGDTPLHCAIAKDKIDFVEYLLGLPITSLNVNVANSKGCSALYTAARDGKADIIKLLLDARSSTSSGVGVIDINQPENMKWTPVAAAAIGGHLSCVELLTSAVTHPLHVATGSGCGNGSDNDNKPELEVSSEGKTRIVTCDVNFLNSSHRSPIYHAATEGHLAVLKHLLSVGADANICSNKGFTPLSACAKRGEKEAMLMLLKHGASLSISNHEGWTAVHSAVSGGKLGCLEILIEYGADVRAVRKDGMSPAFLAAATGRAGCLKLLTSDIGGINPSHCDPQGRSLAFFAATSKIGDTCLEVLFAHPNAVASTGIAGSSTGPFSELAVVDQKVMPQCLKGHYLKAPTSKNKYRICELCRKSYVHKPTCLQCVICAYDLCTTCTEDRHAGWSLVHAAASGGSTKSLNCLAKAGANMNAVDHHGNTPLHIAAQSESKASASFIMLLNCGLSLLHVNKFHKRPLDVATQENLLGILTTMSALEFPESLFTAGNCYFWFFVLQLDGEFQEACTGIVRKCLSSYPEKLIGARNSQGHLAITVASKANRAILQEFAYFCGRFDLDTGPAVHCSATSLVILATDYGLTGIYERCYETATTAAPSTTTPNMMDSVGTGSDAVNSSGNISIPPNSSNPVQAGVSSSESCVGMTRAAFAHAIMEVGELTDLSQKWQHRQERYLSSVSSATSVAVDTTASVESTVNIHPEWTNAEFDEWNQFQPTAAKGNDGSNNDIAVDTAEKPLEQPSPEPEGEMEIAPEIVGDTMPKPVFVAFCEHLFGLSRRVAVKFMAHRDQYERELTVRRVAKLNTRFIVGVIRDGPDEQTVSQALLKLKRGVGNTDTGIGNNSDNSTGTSSSSSNSHGQQTRRQGQGLGLDSGKYTYAIVMPAADRSLDAIFRQERPDALQVASLMKQVGLAVQHLHERNVVHGDLKMLNILRVDGRIAVADMDAAAVIGEYACCKFSSAVLPPECFYMLKTKNEEEAYSAYYRVEKESNTELWQKIRPVAVDSKGLASNEIRGGFRPKTKTKTNVNSMPHGIVVKTFRTISSTATVTATATADKTDSPDNETGLVLTDDIANASLPYFSSVVHAHPTLDIWSFGIMLYTLCVGQPLLPSNRDDDLSNKAAVWQACSWTDEQLMKLLHDNISSLGDGHGTGSSFDLAADLLSQIFKVDPKQRLQSMEEVLKHPFLSGIGSGAIGMADFELKLDRILENQNRQQRLLDDIDSKTTVIEYCTQETYVQLQKTEQVLLRGIFEASECVIPTCFVILNQRLSPPEIEVEADQETIADADVSDTSTDANVKTGAISSAAADSAATTAGRWFDKLCDVTSSLLDAAENPGALMRDRVLESLLTEETLYFYLVDEVTMQPILTAGGSDNSDDTDTDSDGNVYPIEIKKYHQTSLVSKLLPLMQVSLKALALVNSVAGLARCLGYPAPCISADVLERGEGLVSNLTQSSSVEDYNVLQSLVDSSAGDSMEFTGEHITEYDSLQPQSDQQSVRGGPLRELKRFLAEHDPQNTFAGMTRVCTKTGLSCWTLPANAQAMERENQESLSQIQTQKQTKMRGQIKKTSKIDATVVGAKPSSLTEATRKEEIEPQSSGNDAIDRHIDKNENALPSVGVSVGNDQYTRDHASATAVLSQSSSSSSEPSLHLQLEKMKDDIISALTVQVGALHASVASIAKSQDELLNQSQSLHQTRGAVGNNKGKQQEEIEPARVSVVGRISRWFGALLGPSNEKVTPMSMSVSESETQSPPRPLPSM